MAGGKDKGLHKIQPVSVEPVSHNFPMVLFAELAKAFGLDQLSHQSVVWNNPALEPPPADPFLHLIGAYVQSLSQGVFGKPVLARARIRSQPVQHGSNRSSRPSQRIQRKVELEEEQRKRKIEAERAEKERQKHLEQARVNRLLKDVAAFQQAGEIRKYVEAIRQALARDGSTSIETVEQWSQWALAQADRIDPANSGKFSKAMQAEETG